VTLYQILHLKSFLQTIGKKTKLIANLKNTLTKQSSISLAFSLVGLLIPVVALYATKGIIILFGFAVLVCLFVFILKKETRLTYPKSLGLSVLSLTIWAVASLIWSISTDLSWTVAHSIPICMLGGLLIVITLKNSTTTDQAFICQSTIWGFFIGLSLALIDITTDFSINKILYIVKQGGVLSIANLNEIEMRGFVINNGVSILAMLLWPTLMILHSKKRNKLALLGFFTTVYIISKSSNFAAAFAVGLGTLSFVVAFLVPRIVYKIAAVGLTLLMLGIPFAMNALPDARTIGKDLPELSYSVYPRLVIWQYASNLIIERPLIGHGIRTSRGLNKADTKISFVYRENEKIHRGNTEAIPLHPHNGLIQIWLELGAGGAVLGLILILCILWNISKSLAPQTGKALACAALACSICLISVSYGLWQSWWLASLWLQGSLMSLSLGSREDSEPL
jgi:exopolysaccharide production protein ExoQ